MNPRYGRERLPQPKNGGERLLNRPRFAPFEGLGHLGLHPRAQLRRGRRSQHVPARDFVTEHAEHTPATTHAQTTKVESILQAAIGRLDPGTRRVTLLVHRGRLFHATSRKPTLLVGEFQSELTITCILDRTLLAKRTLTARRSGHLDSRPSRRLVARARRRPVTRGAG